MKFYHHILNSPLYPKNKAGFGGVTVAYKYENNKIVFSIAQCSPKDRYCRSKGRDIATEKMLKGESLKIVAKGHQRKALKRFEGNLNLLCQDFLELTV